MRLGYNIVVFAEHGSIAGVLLADRTWIECIDHVYCSNSMRQWKRTENTWDDNVVILKGIPFFCFFVPFRLKQFFSVFPVGVEAGRMEGRQGGWQSGNCMWNLWPKEGREEGRQASKNSGSIEERKRAWRETASSFENEAILRDFLHKCRVKIPSKYQSIASTKEKLRLFGGLLRFLVYWG